MPLEIEDVDDHEYLAYVKMKRWRLLRSRALETEAYNIFQNRTLLELVRRRRNDASWATSTSFDERMSDALEVWGVGPSKIEADGFAPQALEVLGGEPICALLKLSREEAPGEAMRMDGGDAE